MKKKRHNKDNENDEKPDSQIKEQERLRKKVTNLIKKQKLPAVRQIVKGADDSKPWGQDAKAKVWVIFSIFSRRIMVACSFFTSLLKYFVFLGWEPSN